MVSNKPEIWKIQKESIRAYLNRLLSDFSSSGISRSIVEVVVEFIKIVKKHVVIITREITHPYHKRFIKLSCSIVFCPF